jgi:hypothetical protein
MWGAITDVIAAASAQAAQGSAVAEPANSRADPLCVQLVPRRGHEGAVRALLGAVRGELYQRGLDPGCMGLFGDLVMKIVPRHQYQRRG